MATNLYIFLLFACASLSRSDPKSCKGRCGEGYYRGSLCQCDYECLGLNECCTDFESMCTTKDSCKGRCGEPFHRGNPCHCDNDCITYKQCCPDYESMCLVEESSDEDMTNYEGTEEARDLEMPVDESESGFIPSDDPEGPTSIISTESPTSTIPSEGPASTTPTEGPASTTPKEDPTSWIPSEVPASTIPTEGQASTVPTEGQASTVPTEGPASTVPTEGPASTVPTEGPASTVPTEGPASTVPTEGPASTVPTEGPASTVPTEGPASTVPTEGQASTVPTEGQASTVPTEGSVSTVTTEGQASTVPKEGPASTVPTEGPATTVPREGPASITSSEGPSKESSTLNHPRPVPEKTVTTPATVKVSKPTKKTLQPSTDNTDKLDPKDPNVSAIKPTKKPIKPTSDNNDKINTGNNKNYQADDYDSNLCSGRPVSGLTTLRNGTIVVFRGHYFWTLDKNRNPEPAQLITEVWGIPSPIDTVYTRCNCQGKTYFFKGNNYWRFENGKMDPGFPKPVNQGFGQISHITAALSIPQYRSRKESVIFFKRGGLAQKYTYQVTPQCGSKPKTPVFTVRNRFRRGADSALGKVISISRSWRGFPTMVTSAVSVPSRVKEGYKYYVFSQNNYYSMKLEREKPVIIKPAKGQKENPESSFFKCPDAQRN